MFRLLSGVDKAYEGVIVPRDQFVYKGQS